MALFIITLHSSAFTARPLCIATGNSHVSVKFASIILLLGELREKDPALRFAVFLSKFKLI
jgi:hypothetical protein